MTCNTFFSIFPYRGFEPPRRLPSSPAIGLLPANTFIAYLRS
jgi:hypothetical protein